MGWETIDNPKPQAASKAVGPMAVALTVRKCMGDKKYIALKIGGELARRASIVQPEQRLRLMIGSGSDAGKLAVSVDAQGGAFLAKRQKNGSYNVTITAAAAEGLFSLAFAPFTREVLPGEVIRPENGQPVFFAFKPDPQLFAVED